jgi:NAD(P)-dependent dehydrogenase (short-subunit alcohol dehydrogenase family)
MTKKVALVTGGSTGIGAAVAIELANAKFNVLITGRNEHTLKTTAGQHENISYLVSDVSDPEAIDATIDHIRTEFGRLDVLVNNAGVAVPVPFENITPEHFDTTFNINIRGVVFMTQKALPLLKESKGNIINISSIVGDQPFPNFLIYSATKGAVITISKGLAKELAPYGIRVNAVSPGPIETPFFDKMGLDEGQKDGIEATVGRMVPLGRFGTAEEVAKTVAFLASDKASYITGAQYKIDGGFSA